MDTAVMRAINGFAGGPLDGVGLFVAGWLVVVIAALAALPFFSRARRPAAAAGRILASGGIALIAAELLKLAVRRPRPFAALSGIRELIAKNADDWSFPSSHAAIAFGIAFGLWFWNRAWGVRALILASLMGLGRVFVGVHYPSDVLGGALLGFLAAVLLRRR
jgi:undecaprenyl-diphosphatase